jgi:putative CRISPR-associated protein (TIGR02619 family)
MRVIVSPVGISLFLNTLNRDETDLRRKLNQHSNDQELPDELAGIVEGLAHRAAERLETGNVEERRRLSAELNGLYGLYDNQLSANGDVHILVATDTALGVMAAQTVERFLRTTIGILNVQLVRPRGLNTASMTSFSQGVKEMLNEFEKTIPGYKESRYEVIFNLTGGFKSLQGYLNIIGMFYADRLVYIFEGGPELLNIPRLPLKIDEDKLREHASELARLAAGGDYPRSELNLPGALLNVNEQGNATISDWGQLIWNRIKKQLLQKELLVFPYLEYENSFRKDFDSAEAKARVQLQETLAKVSVLLEKSGGDLSSLKQDGGLKYDNYSGRKLPGGTPLGHFRIDRGNRVTCMYQGGKLYLRHFGSHDYTQSAEKI